MAEVKNYAVRMYSDQRDNLVVAQVHLFDEKNKMVGGIDFYSPPAELPSDTKEPFIKMNMRIDRLFSVVDLLRNEKPIYLEWQEHLHHAYLSTTQEPVGEGEDKITIEE
ncbi:MAG: hypothetical protein D6730_02025 [Bacteroidetes bacterium]|nr:MAG: hypothetical protein D6730_02025 [Bacteroidota bacterium]